MQSLAVIEKLKKIEHEHSVKVLYAAESGSRAWGFASTDSDYDVRFIYVHLKDWYLSIEPKRDVIEIPLDGDLDISGWDFPKALGLFRKSNPALYEWLQSPIVYVKPHPSIEELKRMSFEYFSSRSCLMHYFSMADKNLREQISESAIKLKKYFYILRPLFACEWIEKNGTMPPTEFESLLKSQRLSEELSQVIASLLADKKEGR